MTHTIFMRRRDRLRRRQQHLEPINKLFTTMNNWKTTLIGAALAGLAWLQLYQQNGGNLSDWKQWAIPCAIAVLGFVAKDYNVSGKGPALVALTCLLLPACTNAERDAVLDEVKVSGTRVLKAGAKAAEDAALAEVRGFVNRTAAKQPVNVQP